MSIVDSVINGRPNEWYGKYWKVTDSVNCNIRLDRRYAKYREEKQTRVKSFEDTLQRNRSCFFSRITMQGTALYSYYNIHFDSVYVPCACTRMQANRHAHVRTQHTRVRSRTHTTLGYLFQWEVAYIDCLIMGNANVILTVFHDTPTIFKSIFSTHSIFINNLCSPKWHVRALTPFYAPYRQHATATCSQTVIFCLVWDTINISFVASSRQIGLLLSNYLNTFNISVDMPVSV